MKIAHFITTIDRGGAENQLTQMIVEQKDLDNKITLFYLKGQGYWSEFINKNDIECIGPLFPKGNYLSFIDLYKLIKILLKKRYDILHVHMPPALVVIFISKIFFLNYRPSIIYTSHNDEPFFPFYIFDKYFSNLIFSIADQIIAISSSVKSFLNKRYNLKKDKITIINYGFRNKFYDSNVNIEIEQSYLDQNNIYFGTVARLVPQKRLDLLIKAFSRVKCENNNNNFKLVIIGNGFLKNKLIKLSKEEKVFDDIFWIDYTENVVGHMKNWDLFCLTSAYEGFGLVLLEAISSGVPILAMNTSSIKEIIGQCGETVPFGDVETFSIKMKELIKNKKSFIDKKYIKKFSFEKNIYMHKILYNKLLN